MKISKSPGGYSTRIYLGLLNGKRIYKRITAQSKTELKKIATQLLSKPTEKPHVLTLHEAFERFIENRSYVLSPTTIRTYISSMNNYFQELMNIPLNQISSEMVQKEVNVMASCLSPKTIRNAYTLLTSVCSHYYPDTKFTINIPKKQRTEVHIPSKDDVTKILNFCHRDPYYSKFEIPIALAAYNGLRRGEICALTYDDIDLTRKTVTINKAMVVTYENEYALKSPKTYAGYRTLDLPDYTIAAIKDRIKKHLPLIEVNPPQITNGFPTILSKSGVKHIRFHDLRHFYASLLLTIMPDIYAIRLTGHASTTMLKSVYQHVFMDQEDKYKTQVLASLNQEMAP